MYAGYVKKKAQKFETYRAISPLVCYNCGKCQDGGKDFLCCANYSPVMEREVLSVSEWWTRKTKSDSGKDIRRPIENKIGMFASSDAIKNFVEDCLRLPEGMICWPKYPCYGYKFDGPIEVVFGRIARSREDKIKYGEFIEETHVSLDTFYVWKRNWRVGKQYIVLAERLRKKLLELSEIVSEKTE